MKIRLVILASLAIGLFAALGPASAMAESTQMCEADEEPCAKPAKHFHLTGQSTLLTSAANIECSTLYLADTNGTLEAHQPLEGTLTFSGCSSGGKACEASQLEEEKPGEIERSGTELGWWHIHVYILWRCGSFFHCTYRFWIWWHFLGPLNGGGTNGTLTSTEEEGELQSGVFCPKTAKFDGSLESLSPIYMKS
jgi:hypothetical protein